MSKGTDNLKHIVVLMMENRSFDHMLGGLKKADHRINGLNGNESNPDSNGNPVQVQPLADYQISQVAQTTALPLPRHALLLQSALVS